jgi:hypothetical protein
MSCDALLAAAQGYLLLALAKLKNELLYLIFVFVELQIHAGGKWVLGGKLGGFDTKKSARRRISKVLKIGRRLI